MSVHNKATLRRLFEEVWNQGDLDAIDEILAPDFNGHFLPSGIPNGPEGFRMYVTGFRTAMPDLHMQVEDLIAEGDRVAIRITARGTQTGPLGDIPASGRKLTLGAMIIARFDENGRYAEGWGEHDRLTLLQQLDAIPVSS